MGSQSRTSVILLDRNGYNFYRDRRGESFLPADRYAVRLVTDTNKIAEATGPELESVVGVPRNDYEAYAEAARRLYLVDGKPATRLVAIAERLMLPAARLREDLGIAGPSMPETILVRDKVLMKQHLRKFGIRVPDFAPFSEGAAQKLFRTHPALIVKPRLGAGTEKTFLLRSAADLAEFMESYHGQLDEFDVEEYINGDMFHVDSVVKNGEVVVATAGRYLDETIYYRTKHCQSVAVPSGPLLDEILEFNQRVVSSYQGYTGVTHHEMFVTSHESVHCEIGGRAGGCGIGACFWSRTGVNLHQIVVRAQTEGYVPSSIEVSPHLTGWVVIHAGPGVLLEPIRLPDKPWVLEAQISAEAGSLLPEPTSCGEGVAVVSVRGSTEAEVTSRLAEVLEVATPRVESTTHQGTRVSAVLRTWRGALSNRTKELPWT